MRECFPGYALVLRSRLKPAKIALPLVAGWALAGCASLLPAKSPDPPPDPLGELRTELQEIRKAQENATRALSTLTSDIATLQNAVARLSAEARQRESNLATLQGNVAELSAQVRTLSAGTPVSVAPLAGTGAAGRSPSGPQASAEELYESALRQYRAGELDSAILQLYDLVASYPQHRLRDGAQLLVGDIYYRQKDYEAALAEFQALLADLPRSEKAPEALLKSGLCYRALGDPARARSAWERVVREFPKSAAAKQAQSLLGRKKG